MFVDKTERALDRLVFMPHDEIHTLEYYDQDRHLRDPYANLSATDLVLIERWMNASENLSVDSEPTLGVWGSIMSRVSKWQTNSWMKRSANLPLEIEEEDSILDLPMVLWDRICISRWNRRADRLESARR